MLTDTEFSRLKQLVPRCSAPQTAALQRLLQLNRATTANGAAPPPRSVPKTGIVLQAILQELRRRGLLRGNPPAAVLANITPAFHDKAAQAWGTLTAGAGSPLSPEQQVLLAQLAVRALAARLYAPVCLKTLMNAIHLLPEMFDRAYPGYLAAGWVPALLAASGSDGMADA